MGNSLTCLSKVIFFTELTGEIRASDLNFEHNYEKFRVYKCKHCAYYHLTTHSKDK